MEESNLMLLVWLYFNLIREIQCIRTKPWFYHSYSVQINGKADTDVLYQ